ncbi:growth inhibitor [Thiovulum sp. ES]|nr:growth inhibitor [Thiovulum sp. ES]
MNIKQGEIWLIEFNPQVGEEIKKVRPTIIVSSDIIGNLPLKTVVPITNWNEKFSNYPWLIKIEPNNRNGLSKVSGIDCFQIKNLSHQRFIKKIGFVDDTLIKDIHQKIAKTLNPIYSLG